MGRTSGIKRSLCAALAGIFAFAPVVVSCTNGSGSDGGTGNEWKEHEHRYEEKEIQAATCEESGKKIKKCECGDIKEEEEIAPLGHEWSDFIYNGDADCANNGTETATCERCGKTLTREKTNTKLGHDYGEYVYNNDATCTEDGTETKECRRCGDRVTRVKENSRTGHKIQTTEKAPTCAEDGYTEEKCLLCEYYKYEVINSNGHRYKYGVCEVCKERDYITPTEGLVYENNTVKCGNNDDIIHYTVIVIAKEHDGKEITTIDAETFYGCNMEEIILPESLTEIGISAFDGCMKLKEITVPNKVEKINFGTFYGCCGLKKVIIPTSVKYIDELAFGECGEVTIYYLGSESEWNAVTLADGWNDGSSVSVVFGS